MKKLLFVVVVTLASHMHPSASKPVLSKAVADSGFGKAVDAGNFREVYNLIAHNRISGFPDRQNALAYLFMTVDMANLSKDDQNTILSLLTDDHLPPAMASGLSITPSNRAWLEKVAPAYAKNTNVVAGPAAPAVPRVPGPAPKPAPAPIRAPSEDPTQIMIPGEPGMSYRDVINAWNKGQWGLAANILEILSKNTPNKVHPKALTALLQTLFGNIAYEVWVKMDADPRSRLAALARQYGVQTPRSDISSIPGGPSPEPAPGLIPGAVWPEPDIKEEDAFSYEAAKKAWRANKWKVALQNLQAFDANPGAFTKRPLKDILEEMVKETNGDVWYYMRPNAIRQGLEKLLKQYGVNPPKPSVPDFIPPPPPPPPPPPVPRPLPKKPLTLDDARIAWERKTKSGQADSEGLNEALDILESFAKKDPKSAPLKAAIAQLVKYADSAYWSNLTPDQPKRIAALAKLIERPLPPVPDNALIEKAKTQTFADAIKTLLKVTSMNSDAFRKALDELFLKQPPRGSYADVDILTLVKGGYPEIEARNNFYDRISNFGAPNSQLQKRNRLVVDILIDLENKMEKEAKE